jgi:hypothetical protein
MNLKFRVVQCGGSMIKADLHLNGSIAKTFTGESGDYRQLNEG